MPELPDIVVYQEHLRSLLTGRPLHRIRLLTPFVLRSVVPPIDAVNNHMVRDVQRIGKRLVLAFDDDLFAVIHLMVAGRLRWRATGKSVPKSMALAAFDFSHGTVFLTEAGSKRRAALHMVRGAEQLAPFMRGGVEPLEMSAPAFAERLRSENHTLKRALTDPRLMSGIGNAYSDEILHRARLSPVMLTSRISDDEIERLHASVQSVLTEWIQRLRSEAGENFPEKVTAFHAQMAVHGRFGKPCPDCEAPVQRIRYADNETNYCARCQTGGRLLADRALSRLLKSDWPRTLDALEAPCE